jgi:hypothetical protein
VSIAVIDREVDMHIMRALVGRSRIGRSLAFRSHQP